MPILVKAAAGAGTRHAPRSLATHRSAEAFASGSRRAAATVSPAPHRCCPKLWPARTRLGARDKPGKEREAQLQPAAPASLAICSNALLGAKSGSESWIPALLGATLAAPAAAASSLRLGRREPRLSSLAAPFQGSLSLEAALLRGSGFRGHTPSSVSCRNSGLAAPTSPELGPHRAGSRALPRAHPVSTASPFPAGLPGLTTPEPTTAPPFPL